MTTTNARSATPRSSRSVSADAALARRPARRGPGDPHDPRRARRRREPDRHRRRVRARRRDVGHNERLIAKALRGRRDGVIVATKGGHTRVGQAWELDGRPEHIRAACEASLAALETDVIDLYQFHRPDPDVPYAESIGAFKELRDEGKVRWVGVSNASVEQIEEALSDRRHRQRPEPARAGLRHADRQGRADAGDRARARVPALVAARRDRQRRRHRRRLPGRPRRPRSTACRPSRSCSRGCSRSGRR